MGKNKYTPTDAQSRAVNSNGKVIVAAGAGSGKTTTMIQRILRNLADGASLRRMLILVYNNAAADELRVKLHQALFESSANGGADSEIFCHEIDELPFAQIGTIHSFCQTIIRENFEKLGISPTFEVLDETTHNVYKATAIENVFSAYTEMRDVDFETIVEIFSQSRKEENLKTKVFNLYNQLEIQPDKDVFLSKVRDCFDEFEKSNFAVTIQNSEKSIMKKATAECNTIFPMLILAKEDKYASNVQSIGRLSQEICDCSDLFSMLDIANREFEIEKARRNGKSQEVINLVERAKSVAHLVCDRMKALSENFADIQFLKIAHAQNKKYIDKLVEIALRFGHELDRLKTQDNYLSFQDLEHKAVQLTSCCEHLKDNFDFVFVDEYQDINPMQECLIDHMIKGNCFMVGDTKQSIYGFRLADPTIFLNRQKRYQDGEGEAINFTKNFRSENSLLNFVNAIFDVCMTLESADMDYKGVARFDSEGEKIAGNVQLHLFPPSKSTKEEASGVYRIAECVHSETENSSQNEGKFIAREIKTLIGRAKTESSFLDFGDIAILFRSRNDASRKIIAELANAGIPVDDGAFQKSSIKPESDLVSFLKVIDNPRQDLPLAGFLLSFFGGYNQTELAEIATYTGNCFYDKMKECAKEGCNKNTIDNKDTVLYQNTIDNKDTVLYQNTIDNKGKVLYQHTIDNKDTAINAKDIDKKDTVFANCHSTELGKRLLETLSVIANYRTKSSFKSVGELMMSVVSDFSYDAYLMRAGEATVNGLSAFIDASLSFENISLSKFLRKYEETHEKIENKSSGGNRVHISTFHGYKGQEIPVVFVADIASAFMIKSSTGDLIFDGKGYIGIKFFDKSTRTKGETLSRLGVAIRVRERESKEEMRLLYVALTRAKQYLYVTGAVSKTALASFGIVPVLELPSSNLDHLSNAVASGKMDVCTIFHNEEEIPRLKEESYVPLLMGGEASLEKLINDGQKYVYPHKFATELAMKYSVSAIDSSDENVVRVFDESANIGTLYHRVMEHINYDCKGVDGVVAELERLESEGILTIDEKNLVKPSDISRCLSSDLMQLARESKCLREQSFMMYVPANELNKDFSSTDKVLVQGVVDLIIDGEQKIIVDFKNSHLKDEKMLEKYKKQLYLYKKAVKGLIKAENIKVELYSFKTGKTLEL